MFKKRSHRKVLQARRRQQVRELRRGAVQLKVQWDAHCRCCDDTWLWEWHFELREGWKAFFASK
jgi:hypothetical protein